MFTFAANAQVNVSAVWPVLIYTACQQGHVFVKNFWSLFSSPTAS